METFQKKIEVMDLELPLIFRIADIAKILEYNFDDICFEQMDDEFAIMLVNGQNTCWGYWIKEQRIGIYPLPPIWPN